MYLLNLKKGVSEMAKLDLMIKVAALIYIISKIIQIWIV